MKKEEEKANEQAAKRQLLEGNTLKPNAIIRMQQRQFQQLRKRLKKRQGEKGAKDHNNMTPEEIETIKGHVTRLNKQGTRFELRERFLYPFN